MTGNFYTMSNKTSLSEDSAIKTKVTMCTDTCIKKSL